jgi:hypothetical protein
MTFWGFTNYVRDNFTCELLHVRKDNSIALMMHKPFQLNIFNGTQRMVVFGNVKHQILKELFLSRVSFFVRDSSAKKTTMEPVVGFLFFLVIWFSVGTMVEVDHCHVKYKAKTA